LLNIKHLIFIIIIFAIAAISNAAEPPTLQNSVEKYDPGRTSTDLSNKLKNKEEVPTHNEVIIRGKPANISAAGKGSIKFMCRQIILTGNTVFTTEKLEKLYKNKLNSEITLADLALIAQSITDYYRNAGYILSQAVIPPQEIGKDGVVRIKIIEGYINKSTIKGCTRHNVCNLLNKYADRITSDTPTRLSTLERFSFLANDIPGVRVRVVLTKSAEITGAADLTFIVDEKNFGAFVAYNDYSPTVLGRQQFIANAYVDNLTSGSETAINGIISRYDTRLQYGSFTHKQQLNDNGLGVSILVSKIETNPNMGTIGLGEFIIPGTAFMTTATTEYAWIRSHRNNLYVGVGFKFLNSSTTFGDAQLFKDNIRSINIYTSYNNLSSENTYNLIIATVSRGLNIFDAQGNPPSRIGEHINFSKIDIYASTSHNFVNSKFSTVLAIKGQYAFNIVPSSETFAYGGVPIGYGYEPSEFIGDQGVAGLFQLQHSSFAIPRWKLNSQIFGFLDCGFVWNRNKTIQPSHQFGSSTGVGYKIDAMRHLSLDFTVAAPLKPSTITGMSNFVRLLFNIKVYA
jgi:hemolysin activation/secretion protein